MKKYNTPKAEIEIFSCEDIVAIAYSAQGEGNFIAWDDMAINNN